MTQVLGDALLTEFQVFLEARRAEHGVPGVAVGLLTPQGRHTFTAGVTSLENPLPVTDRTLFLLGSIGKTYTATLVMTLVEQGQLTLNTPVKDIVPELRLADENAVKSLTVQHLLTHSGGWWEQSDEATGDGDDALARFIGKLADVPQISAPGHHYAYSNSGFNLLGRVIEKRTGQTYEAAMTTRVLEPLGLTDTFFFPIDVMTRRFAVGHENHGGEWVVARPWTLPRAGNASGGLSSSVQDQLTYAALHLGQLHPNSLLQDNTRQQMQRPHLGDSPGLSWHLYQQGGVKFVSHNGGMPGQHALIWLIPERGVACVILTNSDGGPDLYGDLSEWLQQNWLKLPPPEALAPFTATIKGTDFIGLYRPPHLPEGYDISEQNGQLALTLISDESPQFLGHLHFTAPNTAVSVNNDDPQAAGVPHEFLRGETGRVEFMRVFGRLIPREKTA